MRAKVKIKTTISNNLKFNKLATRVGSIDLLKKNTKNRIIEKSMKSKTLTIRSIAHLFFGIAWIVFFAACSNSAGSNTSNGVKEGEQLTYYENGQLKSKEYFKNGVLEGEQQYYFPDGSLEEKLSYKNGLKEGDQFSYYDNGQLEEQEYFENAIQEGKRINYY
ncbi:MAG: toxin-antitoxin system YwqK family antitoxin [Flavobacteriales bacterium]|nr:toxin-antitoxin system YwqK family antitoxin [Flavobacteriales bacterium]